MTDQPEAVVNNQGAVVPDELKTVKSWATTKVANGNEPPWSWYQYMKLIEAIAEIESGVHST